MKEKKDYPIINKDIYKLKMFEHASIDIDEAFSYTMRRVPGGWIWDNYHGCAFIPFVSKTDSDIQFNFYS